MRGRVPCPSHRVSLQSSGRWTLSKRCSLAPLGSPTLPMPVAYSLYHFCRVFSRATHHTPYDYLMRRRLAQAARELNASDRNIIDIALEFQFNSAETFSRAFKRVHGVQPSVYRKGGRIDHRGLMPRLTLDHLIQIRDGWLSRPVMMRGGTISLVGIMVQIDREGTAEGALWEFFAEELAEIKGWRQGGDAFGITWYPRNWQNRGTLYLAAVQLPDADVGGAPLMIKRIPAQHYARFVYRGGRGPSGARAGIHLSHLVAEVWLLSGDAYRRGASWRPLAGRDRLGTGDLDTDYRHSPWPCESPPETSLMVLQSCYIRNKL